MNEAKQSIQEYEDINKELAQLRKRTKELRARQNILMQNISNYLDANGGASIKYKGKIYKVTTKTTLSSKK